MLEYDEDALLETLVALPPRLQAAFAAGCAERLSPRYAAFAQETGAGSRERHRDVLDVLWSDLEGEIALSTVDLDRLIDEVMPMIPSEDEFPDSEEQPGAEDAGAALAYALRSRRHSVAQEAAWAARRAFEAVDYAAEGDESSDVVQRELRHQQEDLAECRDIAQSNEIPVVRRLRSRARMRPHGADDDR